MIKGKKTLGNHIKWNLNKLVFSLLDTFECSKWRGGKHINEEAVSEHSSARLYLTCAWCVCYGNEGASWYKSIKGKSRSDEVDGPRKNQGEKREGKNSNKMVIVSCSGRYQKILMINRIMINRDNDKQDEYSNGPPYLQRICSKIPLNLVNISIKLYWNHNSTKSYIYCFSMHIS